MSQTIQITSGPSREELFDGLRLFAEKRQVGFLFENNGRQITLPFSMQSIQAEDGSGNSWNVQMVLHIESFKKQDFALIPITLRMAFIGHVTKTAIVVKGYYSTKKRKGVITID